MKANRCKYLVAELCKVEISHKKKRRTCGCRKMTAGTPQRINKSEDAKRYNISVDK